jgi:predicted glycosyltransferase
MRGGWCEAAPPRASIMFYSPDSYGLGHLRRTLALVGHLRTTLPDSPQLVVTGQPVAHGFTFPDGVDYVKLPSVVKTGAGQYEPRSLAADFAEIRDMRSEILLSAARHFRPDIFIVDHAPAGLLGEAVATLRYVKEESPGTHLVVGLRDVIDEPSAVRSSWEADGVYELLDDVYDLILVYGRRELCDIVAEYGLSARAAAKTRFVGYLRRQPGPRPPELVRAALPLQTDRLVLVTAGGGQDGKALFDTALQATQDRDWFDFDCLLVGGPLMDPSDRDELQERASSSDRVHFIDFADEMTDFIGAADAVVSMGGYNSVCEILSLERPAIIVPRVEPRREQLIRADRLSRLGLVQMIHPSDLSAGRLHAELNVALAEKQNGHPRLPLDGLEGVEREVSQLLRRENGSGTSFSSDSDSVQSVTAAEPASRMAERR